MSHLITLNYFIQFTLTALPRPCLALSYRQDRYVASARQPILPGMWAGQVLLVSVAVVGIGHIKEAIVRPPQI